MLAFISGSARGTKEGCLSGKGNIRIF